MTSPCFLRWFMSNSPVFGHCVPMFEDKKVERRGERKRRCRDEVGSRGERKQTKEEGTTRGDEKTKQACGLQP